MASSSQVSTAAKAGVHRRPSHPQRKALTQCQVSTPDDVVDLVWRLVAKGRPQVEAVIDLGAGHCQFALPGRFATYLGVEIDPTKGPTTPLPTGAQLVYADALDLEGEYDLAIGNPPYTRHHRIGKRWRKAARAKIYDATATVVSEFANLYLYFMWLALLRTKPGGMVALVVPYEWATRPSAASFREYALSQGYRIDVYRFERGARVFTDVKTTACVTVIDKLGKQGLHFWDVNGKSITPSSVTRSADGLLPYAKKVPQAYAFRGLSSGSQDVFVLTEAERKRAGITRNQVVPCVTSLRSLDSDVKTLDADSFELHFVKAGRKCWLLKTNGHLSTAVRRHVNKAPNSVKKNWTCRTRSPWYSYPLPATPNLIYSSGFRGMAPRVVANEIGARATGSAYGIKTDSTVDRDALAEFLTTFPFADRVVPHANGLLKVEVSQMNGVLADFARK